MFTLQRLPYLWPPCERDSSNDVFLSPSEPVLKTRGTSNNETRSLLWVPMSRTMSPCPNLGVTCTSQRAGAN